MSPDDDHVGELPTLPRDLFVSERHAAAETPRWVRVGAFFALGLVVGGALVLAALLLSDAVYGWRA